MTMFSLRFADSPHRWLAGSSVAALAMTGLLYTAGALIRRSFGRTYDVSLNQLTEGSSDWMAELL